MSKAVAVPKPMSPASMNSCAAWLTSPPAMKISATPGKGARSIEVHSPWGNINFGWPKDVKPVAFTIEHAKKTGTVMVSAPGFTEANKADYKAAFEAVVPMAIAKAQAQKEAKTKG